MSNIGKSDLGNPLIRSVEQDDNASPAKDSSNEMAKANNISEHGRDDTSAEPKTNDNLDPDSIEINSNGHLRSPVHLSHPLSRSCSLTEQQNYQTFRSPINDSRGYYANALRRRELGSASPPPSQQRRVAPHLNNPSPPYLSKSIHDDSSTRAHRASPGPQIGRDQSDVEIDEQSPARYAPSQSPYHNFQAGPPSRAAAGYGGRTLERESFGERNQQAQSDPYVGVDTSMDLFDDESDIYNGSLGGREYPSPSQLVQSGYHPRFQIPQFGDREKFVQNGETDHRQREKRVSQSRRPVENDEQGFDQRRIHQNDTFHGPPFLNDENETLFIPDIHPKVNAAKKQAVDIGSRGGRPYKQLFSHETYLYGTPYRASVSTSVAAGKKRNAMEALQDGGRFNQPGAVLDPSRYSGDPSLNWGLNQDPPSVSQTAVSDAALLKRGLTRGAKEKVCKRGYGANDPENVNIVNMKEDGMSFAEIVEALNETRVANGRAPSLSVCGVTSRYNRTAPLLFAAEGKQFIPLSKRGKGQVLADGPLYERPVWNDQLDLVLAQVVKDIDKDKWTRVAMEYNRRTGKNISAQSAALRHTIL
ncbi:hypothetical protein DL98DRAFT_653054 [Cadophora sp. DSE1049]|nr:hypothetical protein DL98DRAFT_653054 [Cadophora sp. DSE1049]